MTYDKDSFLAGIAVGRQLKGWATAYGAQTISAARAVMGYVKQQRHIIPEITIIKTLMPAAGILTPAVSVAVERSPHYDVDDGAAAAITPADGLLTPWVLMEAEGGGAYAIRAGTVTGTLAPAPGILGAAAGVRTAIHSHTTSGDNISGAVTPPQNLLTAMVTGVMVKDE